MERTAELSRKYGKVLAWARRERISASSSLVRILASRVDQLLTQQVVLASSIKYVNVNDIYGVLWQLESLVDQILEILAIEVPNSTLFIQHLLQDSITLELSHQSPLTLTKYDLFKDWMILQRNLLVAWLCYGKLPSHSEDFWIEMIPEVMEGASKTGPDQRQSSNFENSKNIWKAYRVIKERLPVLMISETMANQILFIGIATKVLDLAKKRDKHQELWIQRVIATIFQSKTSEQGFCTFFGHWDALEATSKINELEKWAAKALYSLIMVDSQFQSHLLIMRDFYFLQDGFFYRTLFSLASNLMELTPGINAEHDINIFFQEAAVAKQFLGEDTKSKLFHNFRLTFAPSYGPETDKSISRVWSHLSLDYSVQWPLNLILSSSILHQYNEIFQFLFQVKKVQIGLQNGWNLLRTPKLPFRLTHRFQLLRNQMAFFIDTLSQYLHVDVFSSQIQALDERMRVCKDFEDLSSSHQHFLSQVLLECFLSVPAFKRTFSNIFDIIASFTTLIRDFSATCLEQTSTKPLTSISSATKSSEAFVSDLESAMKEWAKHNNLLFVLLSGVKGQAPHLHHLLLLLDYSLFCSNGKSLLELENDHAIDWTTKKAPRMRHSRNSIPVAPPSTENSEAGTSSATSKASSSTDTQPQSMKLPRLAKQTTAKRTRSASVEAPPVAEPPKPKASGGPRPELLARLMKKSNK